MSSKDIIKDLSIRWRKLDNKTKKQYIRRANNGKKV